MAVCRNALVGTGLQNQGPGATQRNFVCAIQLTASIREGATGMNQAFRTYPKVRAMKQQESELTEDDS